MTTPVPPPLVVDPEVLARRLRVPLPLTEGQRWTLEQAIRDAQADMEAYLGRAITPRTYTETGVVCAFDGGWQLTHHPVQSITSITPEPGPWGYPTSHYTIVYVAGLDTVSDPDLEPIRRMVRAHAAASPEVRTLLRRAGLDDERSIRSLSVEGQSVTYIDESDESAYGPGQAGALPSFTSCDRWRLAGRRVYQRHTHYWGPWPHTTPWWW